MQSRAFTLECDSQHQAARNPCRLRPRVEASTAFHARKKPAFLRIEQAMSTPAPGSESAARLDDCLTIGLGALGSGLGEAGVECRLMRSAAFWALSAADVDLKPRS